MKLVELYILRFFVLSSEMCKIVICDKCFGLEIIDFGPECCVCKSILILTCYHRLFVLSIYLHLGYKCKKAV